MKKLKLGQMLSIGVMLLFSVTLSIAPKAAYADADTEAPVVSILSPSGDITVRKNTDLTIVASATDNVGVANVAFTVQNSAQFSCPPNSTLCVDPEILICSGTATTCTWHTPNTRGTYILTVTANDAALNLGSSSITVTVK